MSERLETPREEIEVYAKILGDNSAAALALKDYDARIANGEDPVFYRIGDKILVGPRLTPCAED